MGIANDSVDPANVVQSLVYTLIDVFDATRDLYNTLKDKEKRDNGRRRSGGYPVEDEERRNDASIIMDKAAVTRQFDIGLHEVGPLFAIGDVVSQTALQSQIITLQSVIVTTFLYGPTSPDPISHQLSSLLDASRAAGTASVDILAAQQQRQRATLPIGVRATIAPSASRPRTERTDTESTSFSGLTSDGTQSMPQTLYCLYALDLQRDPTQPLASCITNASSPYCPYCKRTLKLAPGKSWEIFKNDEDVERRFHVQNRFVAKCHRDSVDGAYSCILCSKSANDNTETVCGDVKALIRHVWMDHSIGELKHEEDITEVVESADRRRDSMLSFTEPTRNGSRRSVSVGPGRGKDRRGSLVLREKWRP